MTVWTRDLMFILRNKDRVILTILTRSTRYIYASVYKICSIVSNHLHFPDRHLFPEHPDVWDGYNGQRLLWEHDGTEGVNDDALQDRTPSGTRTSQVLKNNINILGAFWIFIF